MNAVNRTHKNVHVVHFLTCTILTIYITPAKSLSTIKGRGIRYHPKKRYLRYEQTYTMAANSRQYFHFYKFIVRLMKNVKDL